MSTYRSLRELGLSRCDAAFEAFVPIRLRVAWNVLRGRPVAYRINIEDGALTIRKGSPRTFVVGCSFRNNGAA